MTPFSTCINLAGAEPEVVDEAYGCFSLLQILGIESEIDVSGGTEIISLGVKGDQHVNIGRDLVYQFFENGQRCYFPLGQSSKSTLSECCKGANDVTSSDLMAAVSFQR